MMAGFTRAGIFNFHNTHIWADENTYAVRENHFQNKFSINIWAGIINGRLIGPHIMPPRLNAVGVTGGTSSSPEQSANGEGGGERQGGGGGRQGGETPRGAKRHGTMESTRGHRASRSDDGDELERSDEGWLDGGDRLCQHRDPSVCRRRRCQVFMRSERWLGDSANAGTSR
jgi:hypothetical protein